MVYFADFPEMKEVNVLCKKTQSYIKSQLKTEHAARSHLLVSFVKNVIFNDFENKSSLRPVTLYKECFISFIVSENC